MAARLIRFTVRVSEAEASELLAGRPPGLSLRAHFLMQKRLLALMAREVVRLERDRGRHAPTFLGLVARRVAEPEQELLPETDRSSPGSSGRARSSRATQEKPG